MFLLTERPRLVGRPPNTVAQGNVARRLNPQPERDGQLQRRALADQLGRRRGTFDRNNTMGGEKSVTNTNQFFFIIIISFTHGILAEVIKTGLPKHKPEHGKENNTGKNTVSNAGRDTVAI